MEGEQLRLLEERINRAIAFIEKLKSREKALIDERDEIKGRLSTLEETVREKDLKIEALKENQLFLKDKIEAILSKLESLASLDAETASFSAEEEVSLEEERFPKEEVSTEGVIEERGELVVEENIVEFEEEDQNSLFRSEGVSAENSTNFKNE